MKKFIIIALAAVMLFSMTTSSMAATVTGGTLKMRMQANTTSYVACYLKNGTTISVIGSLTNGFYPIKGKGYQHSDLSGWYESKSGYGMKAYIKI